MSEVGFRIITGDSHPEFAREVAGCLDMEVCDTLLGTFPSTENRVQIEESVRGEHVFVMQTHGGHQSVNDSLIQQGLMIQAAKLASATEVTAVCPYLGYMRQDRKKDGREALSAKFLIDVLNNAAGADRIVTIDMHSGQVQGYTNKPFDHLTAAPAVEDCIRARFGDEIESGRLVVASPDVGRAAVTARYQRGLELPADNVAIVNKTRSSNNGLGSSVRNSTSSNGVIGDVEGKACILIDDMIDTAGTMVNAADALLEDGASRVWAFATHGVLSCSDEVNAIKRIRDSSIEKLVVTDTLPVDREDDGGKVEVISVADLVAKAIYNIAHNVSVSEIFGGRNRI